MDSNVVARVNVDASCPKIRKKRQNVHSHVGCPQPSVWEMEITVYPLHGQSIGPISTAFNRGRLVTSLRRDTTTLPVSPVHTPWAPTMGAKTPSPRPKSLWANIGEMRDYRPIPNRRDIQILNGG